MSWILGSKGSINEGKRMDAVNRQLHTLYQQFPNTIELEKFRAYRVSFQLGPEQGLSCAVLFTSLYPEEPPKFLIEADVEHAWLTLHQNEVIVTGHPALQPNVAWDPLYPLGKLAKEIEVEFRMRPPQVPFIRNSEFPRFQMPDLNTLSASEMEALLKDDDKFNDYLQTLPGISNFKSIQDSLKTELEKLSTKNLEINNTLEEAKSSLAAKEEDLGSSVMDYSTKTAEQEAFIQKHGPEAMKVQLANLLKKDDSKSEEILSEYQDNGIDLETFLSKYKEARISFHLRSIKLEKLKSHPAFASSIKL